MNSGGVDHLEGGEQPFQGGYKQHRQVGVRLCVNCDAGKSSGQADFNGLLFRELLIHEPRPIQRLC